MTIRSALYLAALALIAALAPSRADALTLDSFETDASARAWTEAGWADASRDAGGAPLATRRAATGATDGASALAVPVRFLGQGYAQAYVGRAVATSFAGAATLSFDVTLPASAPAGLRAKPILFLGPSPAWTEAANSTALVPGVTTRVTLPLAGSFDPAPARPIYADVRGYGLKIEGSAVRFTGDVAIDAVRLEDRAPPAAADLNARSVGTFGGFMRAAGPDVPKRNGFLAFTASSDAARHALLWPKLGAQGGDFSIGEMRAEGTLLGPSALRFLDWTAVEASQTSSTVLGRAASTQVLLSRAFPAARYTTSGRTYTWSGPGTRVAVVLDGRPTLYDTTRGGRAPLGRMSEPWVLVFGTRAGAGFDAPVLLTFERRPGAVTCGTGSLTFDFAGAAGAVNVMPLEGLRRRAPSEVARWDAGLPGEVLVRCRMLVPVLAAFPVSCRETYAIDEAAGTVTVTDRYTFRELRDEWGTIPTRAAAIPPVVYRAGQRGYPVRYPAGAPFESWVATFFGPFAYIPGESATYVLPLPAGLSRLPVALRAENDPRSLAARRELERMIRDEAPAGPSSFYLDNDDRAAAFLAEAIPTLTPGSPERAKAIEMAPRLIEHGFLDESLQTLAEPVTGQTYLNNAKYWASQEPFDKEWYTGRQLAALALVAEATDLDLARALWPKALGLYRYDRIFYDWATGSVLSSVFGFTALADGIHFAWEGMLGMGRLARLVGDRATFEDAAWRAARQQAALFAAWHQAEWVRDIDYAIGHISNARLAPSDVETRGAIDGFVEEFGCATLEFRSFWQTTNFLFFDVVPQASLYRDFGLEGRVRALEYQAMPAEHPRWTDGNAMDPVDKKYYGAEFTAAHVQTRAQLFHEDSAALYAIYAASAGTAASREWYSMRRFGIAGPTLLAIARSGAPVVEAPVALARVEGARWDAARGEVTIDLVGRKDGSGFVRTRASGGAWRETAVTLRAGLRASIVVR